MGEWYTVASEDYQLVSKAFLHLAGSHGLRAMSLNLALISTGGDMDRVIPHSLGGWGAALGLRGPVVP